MLTKNTVRSRPNPDHPSPSHHHHAHRWHRPRVIAGIALFLAGLLFSEGYQAVAQVLEPTPEAAATDHGPATSPFLLRTASTREAARDQEAREVAALAAFEVVHDALVSLAPEGLTLERRRMWRVLADCESGSWSRGVPVAGSRRWDTTKGFFEGGLQFDPRTWDAFRDADMPSSANEALPVTQMVVAERVLEVQGWRAWPVCSRKVGYR